MKALVVLICVSVAAALPVDPEVELVEPVNTNARDPETGFPLGSGNIPIFVIRTSGNRDRGGSGGFPLFGNSDFPSFFGNRRSGLIPPFFPFFTPDRDLETDVEVEGEQVDDILRSLLGLSPRRRTDDDDDVEVDEQEPEVLAKDADDEYEIEDDQTTSRCGFLCTLFSDLGDFADKIETEIEDIHHEMQEDKNKVEPGILDQEGSENNSTYTEEVLPDGTVVKTNRTMIKTPNGVSFVITQTSSFVGAHENDDDASVTTTTTTTTTTTEIPSETTDKTADEETVPFLPENDDNLNEIIPEDEEDPQEVDEFGAGGGVDAGLLEVAE